MSQIDVITYIWLGQAFLTILPWNVDRDIQALIRSGGVAYELLRPMDLYSAWFSRAIALRTAPALMRSVPLIIIAALIFDLQAPASFAAGVAFGITMVGAIILSAAITNVINISLMWTVSGEGVTGFAPAIVMMFSGMVVPIPFFPAWAETVIRILPFSGLVDTPYRLYLGHLPVSDLGLLLGHQLLWTLAFVILGRWMLSNSLKRMTVQGG
ncbi:ABC-2 family transporter protein [Dehalococcoides mccartyi]|nr:ABC-2 family transporter protein [Dehalococcoides mccartyi]